MLATVLAPTAAGLLCAVILRGRAPDGPADLILEAQRAGRRPAFWRGIRSVGASLAALGGGMSVGQYGPLAFLGGLVGGRLHHWSGGYRGAGMACGVAAAIAAAFNAPIAGVLFAHEAILRHYSPRLLALVIIAAVAGHGVSDAFARPPFLPAGAMPANGFADITLALALGVLLGVYGGFFLRSIFALQRAAAAVPPFARPVLAGFLVGLIALFAPAVMGGGQIFLRALTGGAETPAAAAALLSPSQSSFWLLSLAGFAICKTAATALCLGLGAPGGVFSPTLLIGAAAGLLFGILCESFSGAPPWVFAVCGMIAMSAPAIGAPLSGILIVFELTRNYAATIDAAVAAAIACLICHRIAGGSYYEKQLRARGIEIDDSRERYLLSETKIAAIAENRRAGAGRRRQRGDGAGARWRGRIAPLCLSSTARASRWAKFRCAPAKAASIPARRIRRYAKCSRTKAATLCLFCAASKPRPTRSLCFKADRRRALWRSSTTTAFCAARSGATRFLKSRKKSRAPKTTR